MLFSCAKPTLCSVGEQASIMTPDFIFHPRRLQDIDLLNSSTAPERFIDLLFAIGYGLTVAAVYQNYFDSGGCPEGGR